MHLLFSHVNQQVAHLCNGSLHIMCVFMQILFMHIVMWILLCVLSLDSYGLYKWVNLLFKGDVPFMVILSCLVYVCADNDSCKH